MKTIYQCPSPENAAAHPTPITKSTLVAKLSRPKAIAEAKLAAASCFSQAVTAARVHDEQGCFSLTLVVTFENEDEVIVQLQDCEIDLSKVALARGLLGPVVPDIQFGKTQSVAFAYVATLIPGTIWDRVDASADEELSICAEIAQLLTRCSLGVSSTAVVDGYVVPRLQKILEVEDFSDTPEARRRLEGLLNPERVAGLKSLPLSLCHIDVNHRNILVDNDKHVCGLIDWEQANLLPLAMNTWCIRFLSVPIAGGKHLPNERTIPIAEAFWGAFITGLPPSHRSPTHKRSVLTTMQVGLAIIHHFGDYCVVRTNLQEFVDIFDWLEDTFSKMCM
ncbi:uncharacterized protein EV420DRAFT_1282482 [Desarmillaria tabescens]|uniref:Aminoglycoside phosphotransferase domain-containing protein n=1 Tax=Armillaria tabescens TaxID=1929756 RepID=A0AA39J1S1_ARMTA|nr:uncharacterized protein EV420DRAFT_1282482 [Desarmillaria tabescens]KAK0434541.1 hypothetical protein EV420DRAFT_1282482 [Desarmillaria tabescens]